MTLSSAQALPAESPRPATHRPATNVSATPAMAQHAVQTGGASLVPPVGGLSVESAYPLDELRFSANPKQPSAKQPSTLESYYAEVKSDIRAARGKQNWALGLIGAIGIPAIFIWPLALGLVVPAVLLGLAYHQWSQISADKVAAYDLSKDRVAETIAGKNHPELKSQVEADITQQLKTIRATSSEPTLNPQQRMAVLSLKHKWTTLRLAFWALPEDQLIAPNHLKTLLFPVEQFSSKNTTAFAQELQNTAEAAGGKNSSLNRVQAYQLATGWMNQWLEQTLAPPEPAANPNQPHGSV
ncbi:MAG: hypothetical protein SFZ03_06885 [Candidatus Melainabacteria bacterium]|nr:hypothetical protein [Candidatus Melainabacteria bacterium]